MIRLAAQRARSEQVNLVALHVIEVGWDRPVHNASTRQRRAGEKVLSDAGDALDDSISVRLITHCEQSRDAGRAIVEYARKRQMREIFIGSHRFLGDVGLDLGTTAAHVLKHAHCPVVLWHENA